MLPAKLVLRGLGPKVSPSAAQSFGTDPLHAEQGYSWIKRELKAPPLGAHMDRYSTLSPSIETRPKRARVLPRDNDPLFRPNPFGTYQTSPQRDSGGHGPALEGLKGRTWSAPLF